LLVSFSEEEVVDEDPSVNDDDLLDDIDRIINNAIELENNLRDKNTIGEFQKDQEDAKKKKRSSNYVKVDNKTKLEILQKLQNLASVSKGKLKKNNLNQKKVLKNMSEKYKVPLKTVECWFRNKNNPEIIYKLQEKCESLRGQSGKGHILSRKGSKIIYPISIDRTLVDWMLVVRKWVR